MEVVIDDQPATLTGSVAAGDQPAPRPKIYVARWPPVPAIAGAITAAGDVDGRFQLGGLAPGPYRVLALPSGPVPDGASDWEITPELWDRAQQVTLERGQSMGITLVLTDPFLAN